MTREIFFVVLLLAVCFSREKNKKCAIPFVQMELEYVATIVSLRTLTRRMAGIALTFIFVRCARSLGSTDYNQGNNGIKYV